MFHSIPRHLYTLVLYLLLPVVLLRLLWRGLKSRRYWTRWPERFGFLNQTPPPAGIWLHAVSVGEVQAALPLIAALANKYPNDTITLTTTTPTGSQRATDALNDSVFHCYLPYDLPTGINRFLNAVQPRIALIMETELWPNLYAQCRTRGIPLLMANARLSARSAQGYRRIAPLTRQTLERVTTICAQGHEDADRFIHLGASPSTVLTTGSIKFDLKVQPSLYESAAALRRQWGNDRLIWIAASTHDGEDKPVLEAHRLILKALPDTLLILVPRHPERFDKVAQLCRQGDFSVARRSSGETCDQQTQIMLGDTMGELMLLYAASDVAFIGGSLVDVGGHNLIEPAALGLATITGPYTHNFKEITNLLIERGATTEVNDAQTLATTAQRLLADPALRSEAGEKGQVFVQENRGALERLLEVIARFDR